MNPESENKILNPEDLTNLSEAQVLTNPEGFYNPEVERVPVPRTEAARILTRLVDILAPGAINTEGIDTRHQIDVVNNEFQETLVPTKGRHKDEFMIEIGPLLTRLEAIGFGDYLANPYLKNIENFTATDDNRIVFNGLYTPWQYGPKGNVIPSIDLSKLRSAVAVMPNETEAQQAIKSQAETYADIVESSIQEEMVKPIDTFADRLDEPNIEHLDKLRNTLELISDGMIEQVGAITIGTEAKNNSNRDLMKSLTDPLPVLIRSLKNNTKIGADQDRSRYPEFWQLLDRYHKIKSAIGTINNIRNDVRHE